MLMETVFFLAGLRIGLVAGLFLGMFLWRKQIKAISANYENTLNNKVDSLEQRALNQNNESFFDPS